MLSFMDVKDEAAADKEAADEAARLKAEAEGEEGGAPADAAAAAVPGAEESKDTKEKKDSPPSPLTLLINCSAA